MIFLRRAVAVTHRWAGLVLGPLLVAIAVSGAGLALEPALDRLGFTAGTSCAATAPLDSQVAAARAARPPGPIALARLDVGLGEPTIIRFTDGETVTVDPCTGAVLGARSRFGGVFGRLEQLHRLAYGSGGVPNKLLKGSLSLAVAILSLGGGAFLWWPRRRNGWRRALTVDTSLRGRAFALNLHWAVGLSTGLITFVVALTGVPIAFDWAKDALYPLTLSAPHKPAIAAATPTGTAVPLETAWQHLQGLVPAPASALFRFPQKPGVPLEIDAVAQDAPHGVARSTLFLDPADGAVLGFEPYAGLSRGRKLYYWLLAIHMGRAGGWPVDLILCLGVLGVPVLACTGFASWLRRRRRKPVAAAARPNLSRDPA